MYSTAPRSSIKFGVDSQVGKRRRSSGLNKLNAGRAGAPTSIWAKEIADLRHQLEGHGDIFEALNIERPTKRQRKLEDFVTHIKTLYPSRASSTRKSRNPTKVRPAELRFPKAQKRKSKIAKQSRRKQALSIAVGLGNFGVLLLSCFLLVFLLSFIAGWYTHVSKTTNRLVMTQLSGVIENVTGDIDARITGGDHEEESIIIGTLNEPIPYSVVSIADSSLSFVGIMFATGNLSLISSHTCYVDNYSEISSHSGQLGAICNLLTSEDCTLVCFGTAPLELASDSITVTGAIETRSSYGFGIASSYKTIKRISLLEPFAWPDIALEKTVSVEVVASIRTSHASNASRRLGYWQNFLFAAFSVVVLVNIFSRMLLTHLLFTGTTLYNVRIAIRGEIVGSLITSPPVAFFTFSVFALMTSHVYVGTVILGETLETKFVLGSSISVACIVAVFAGAVGALSGIRFSSSGIMLFMYCIPTVPMVAGKILEEAVKRAYLLGQIRDEECLVRCASDSFCKILDWHHFYPVSVSGLEVITLLFWRPVGLALCFFLLSEGILVVTVAFQGRRKMNASTNNSIVHSASRRGSITASASSILSPNSGFSPGAIVLSSYERTVAFEGRSISHFSRIWASPVTTVFGTYHHFISLIEDNLTMWGTLLLPLDTYFFVRIAALFLEPRAITFFLIRRRLYIGVLVTADTLVPRFENRRKIPNYVEDFPFEKWSGNTGKQILLR